MEQWIRVTERLPGESWRGFSDDVLVYDPHGRSRYDHTIYIAQYWGEKRCWAPRDYTEPSSTVTHWMPLPSEPEDD